MFQPLSSRHRTSRAGGLTLIELMIVIAVVATLIALTAPSFKRMIDTQRLRGINAAVITDLQFARAEAASRNVIVYTEFGQDTALTLTCYVIFTGSRDDCDCGRPSGTPVCSGSGGSGSSKEIRTVRIERSLGITVGIPAPQVLDLIGFNPATGRLLVIPIDIPVPALVPFKIEVKHSVIGGFVDELEVTGRPTVCSPSSQLSGVPACT